MQLNTLHNQIVLIWLAYHCTDFHSHFLNISHFPFFANSVQSSLLANGCIFASTVLHERFLPICQLLILEGDRKANLGATAETEA